MNNRLVPNPPNAPDTIYLVPRRWHIKHQININPKYGLWASTGGLNFLSNIFSLSFADLARNNYCFKRNSDGRFMCVGDVKWENGMVRSELDPRKFFTLFCAYNPLGTKSSMFQRKLHIITDSEGGIIQDSAKMVDGRGFDNSKFYYSNLKNFSR